jgi:hypothetical protein
LDAEDGLDSLLGKFEDWKETRASEPKPPALDPIDLLRKRVLEEFVPIFVELVEKYSKANLSLQMDASSFLQGGREIHFEFSIGEHRLVLHGIVTSEAIAFHETRSAPEIKGELVSGPMLRLRNLDAKVFREFICDKLTTLLRSVMRRR